MSFFTPKPEPTPPGGKDKPLDSLLWQPPSVQPLPEDDADPEAELSPQQYAALAAQYPGWAACEAYGVLLSKVVWRGQQGLILVLQLANPQHPYFDAHARRHPNTVNPAPQPTDAEEYVHWFLGRPNPHLGWQVYVFPNPEALGTCIQHTPQHHPYVQHLQSWWAAYAPHAHEENGTEIHLDHLRLRVDALQDLDPLADDELGLMEFVVHNLWLAGQCGNSDAALELYEHPVVEELELAELDEAYPEAAEEDIEDFKAKFLVQLDWFEERLMLWTTRVG
jgi:hypothetical protein